MKNFSTFLGIKIVTFVSKALFTYAVFYLAVQGWRYLILERHLFLGWVTQDGQRETLQVTVDLISQSLVAFALLPAMGVCLVLIVVSPHFNVRLFVKTVLIAFLPFLLIGTIGIAIRYQVETPKVSSDTLPAILFIGSGVYLINRLNGKVYTQLAERLVREDMRFQQKKETLYLITQPWLKIDLSQFSKTVVRLTDMIAFYLLGATLALEAGIVGFMYPSSYWFFSLLVIGSVAWGLWIRKGQLRACVERFRMKQSR